MRGGTGTAHRMAAGLECVRALVLLGRTTVLFRLGGARRVALATERALDAPPGLSGRGGRAALSRSLRAVRRAKALWPLPVLCLQSALVLRALYVRQGLPARVRVGVRLVDGELVSHAWVEVDGIAVDDTRGSDAAWTLIERNVPRGESQA